MPLPNDINLVPRNHLWFARAGATLSLPLLAERWQSAAGSAVSDLIKPKMDATQADTAWVKLGDTFKVEQKTDRSQPIKIRQLVGGKIRRRKTKYSWVENAFEWESQWVSRLALQLAFATLVLDANTTQYNPEEGEVNQLGWLRWQCLQDDGSTVIVEDKWVDLMLPEGLVFDSEIVTSPKYRADWNYSPLNTGALAQ